MPRGRHKRSLKEGEAELTEEAVQKIGRFHEFMECLFRYPMDTVEHIRKQRVMAAEKMNPPVKSGNGDLPVITELADRTMTMEV